MDDAHITNSDDECVSFSSESDEDEFKCLENKYHVMDSIGLHSTVWQAVWIENHQTVTIKKLGRTCDPKRILNEVKCLSMLDGKENVISLIDGVTQKDQVYLVMPYVEHTDFSQYYLKMKEPEIRDYFKALFSALAHVHSHGIIHQDIKPEHFLYCPVRHHYKLIDFGLSQFIGESAINAESPNDTNKDQTQVAPQSGSQGYRAPEILLRVKEQTPAVDVWSVGVILLSILSGRYPFFSSPDDITSLAEIMAICGVNEMIAAANTMGKHLNTNIYYPKLNWIDLCQRLRLVCPESPLRISSSVYHLLGQCLDVNPKRRILAAEVKNHPFLNTIFN